MAKLDVFTELQQSIYHGNLDQFKKCWEEEISYECLAEEDDLFDPLNKPFIIDNKNFAPLFFTAIQGPNSAIAEFLLNIEGSDYGIPSVDISTYYIIKVTHDFYAFSFSKNVTQLAPRLTFFEKFDALTNSLNTTSMVIIPLALAIKYRNFDLAQAILKRHVTGKIAIDENTTFLFSPMYEALKADYQTFGCSNSCNVNKVPSYISMLLSQSTADEIKKYIFFFIEHHLKDLHKKEGKNLVQWVCLLFYDILQKQDLQTAITFSNQVSINELMVDTGSTYLDQKNRITAIKVLPQLDFALLNDKIRGFIANQLQLSIDHVALVANNKAEHILFEISDNESLIVFHPCVLEKDSSSDLLTLNELIQIFEYNLRYEIVRNHSEKLKKSTYKIFIPFFYNIHRSNKPSLAEITLDARNYPEAALVKHVQIFTHKGSIISKKKKPLSKVLKGLRCVYDERANFHEYDDKINSFQRFLQIIFSKLCKLLRIKIPAHDKSPPQSLTSLVRDSILETNKYSSERYNDRSEKCTAEFFKISVQNNEYDKDENIAFKTTLK